MGMGNGGFGRTRYKGSQRNPANIGDLLNRYRPIFKQLQPTWDNWRPRGVGAPIVKDLPIQETPPAWGSTMPISRPIRRSTWGDNTHFSMPALPEQASPIAQERAGGLMGGLASQQPAQMASAPERRANRFMGGFYGGTPLSSMYNLPSSSGGMGGYSGYLGGGKLPSSGVSDNPFITNR